MARTSYYCGPGFLIRNGVRFSDEDGIEIVERKLSEPIMLPYLGGKQGEFLMDRVATITLNAKTNWSSAAFGEYFPHSAVSIGGELYPTVDVPIYFYGKDGTKRSYAASCLVDYPEMDLSFKAANVVGRLQFTCFQAGDTDFGTANSFVQVQSSQTVVTTDAFSVGNLNKVYFTGNLGSNPSLPWLNFNPVNGFKIKPKLNTSPKVCDRWGENQKFVDSVEATAEFELMPEASAAILTKQTWAGAVARGSVLVSQGDLVITGGTTPKLLTVTLRGVLIEEVEFAYHLKNPRNKMIRCTAQGNGTNLIVSDWFSAQIS